MSAEGTTTCYTCHLFHGSNQPKLWRGTKEQCGLGCHEVLEPQGGAPEGEVETEGKPR